MAEEKKEEKRRVTVEDALAVLLKHANVSGDPDDQETVALYLEQEAEDKQEEQERQQKEQERQSEPQKSTTGKGR